MKKLSPARDAAESPVRDWGGLLAWKTRCEEAEGALKRSEKFYARIVARGLRLTEENLVLAMDLKEARAQLALARDASGRSADEGSAAPPPTTATTAPTSAAVVPKFGILIDDALVAAVTGGEPAAVEREKKKKKKKIEEHTNIIDQMKKKNATATAAYELEIKRLRAQLLAAREQANVPPPPPPPPPRSDDHVRTALEQRMMQLHSTHTLQRCVRKWVQRALHKKREAARAAEEAVTLRNEAVATRVSSEQKTLRQTLMDVTKKQSEQLRQASATILKSKKEIKTLSKKVKRAERALKASQTKEAQLRTKCSRETAAWRIQTFLRRHHHRQRSAGVNRELRKAMYDVMDRAQDKFLGGMKTMQLAPMPAEHYYTYSSEEVAGSEGALSCAECDSTVRALKLDVEDDGEADLFCEPCWIEFYGHTFAEHEHQNEGDEDDTAGGGIPSIRPPAPPRTAPPGEMANAKISAAEAAARIAMAV